MKIAILAIGLSLATHASAQSLYKCAGNIYQQQPCADGKNQTIENRVSPLNGMGQAMDNAKFQQRMAEISKPRDTGPRIAGIEGTPMPKSQIYSGPKIVGVTTHCYGSAGCGPTTYETDDGRSLYGFQVDREVAAGRLGVK